MVTFVSKELHVYDDGTDFYSLDNANKTDYEILLVEGYVGDRFYTFVRNTDYEQFRDGIRWLSDGTTPEPVPSTISASGDSIFEISYTFNETPTSVMAYSVHPHIRENGALMTIIHSFGSEILNVFTKSDTLERDHDMTKSLGSDLDHLATWFDVTRLSGESDVALQSRLLEYLTSYVSSGTIDSVSTAIEAYTDTVPDIIELWQSISYFNYNVDDYDQGVPPDQWRTYLFNGGLPDNVYTFQAYFYDELFQLNTFFCILDYSVISEVGLSNIKQVLQKAKAAGVQAYLGWLVDEDFEDETLSDWTVVAP